MVRILIINPNSTATMTDAMVDAARRTVPTARIEGWTSAGAPPAIQGPEDGALAVPPLLDLIRNAGDDFDAIVIGCFDDTGLAEANALAACPVIGIGQAAYHMAALRGQRFTVVTTLAVSVPVIEANIRASGLQGYLGRVRASDIPVLDTEGEATAVAERIAAVGRQAIAEDRCDTIVLGCGGMSRLAEDVRTLLPVPVIDGVEAAARLAVAVV